MLVKEKKNLDKKIRRQRRTRATLHGTAERPRLCVRRSLRYISAQAIDDDKQQTILALHEDGLKLKGDKVTRAKEFGKILAAKLVEKKIVFIVFDRGFYKYHGRVKSLADSLRENGIKF